ncbi:translation initiation factor IF-2-like [Serinus canaria]|uniref:translation initiation factor IF-2-like n=1 Tax=Serinus canaria TaxID=9135 RepID=UPI0021CC5B01|nr:translation initiation factor IF-2-like [Serinus canaria]
MSYGGCDIPGRPARPCQPGLARGTLPGLSRPRECGAAPQAWDSSTSGGFGSPDVAEEFQENSWHLQARPAEILQDSGRILAGEAVWAGPDPEPISSSRFQSPALPLSLREIKILGRQGRTPGIASAPTARPGEGSGAAPGVGGHGEGAGAAFLWVFSWEKPGWGRHLPEQPWQGRCPGRNPARQVPSEPVALGDQALAAEVAPLRAKLHLLPPGLRGGSWILPRLGNAGARPGGAVPGVPEPRGR